ncbi:hypothetical protein [Bacillus cereus]|uniref:hypothetical protein n=1 Tax=Bacillus cereus TaxID=1396 RepID=UPI000B4B50BF|nr:hypothetical protein [Bacillus cereus]
MTIEGYKISALIETLIDKVNNASQDGVIVLEKSTVIEIINYIKENEEIEIKEDSELAARYGSRTELPEDQWITKVPKQPLEEWYKERKQERLKDK